MRKKDIITIIICLLVIVVCIYFIYQSLFKKPSQSPKQAGQNTQVMDFTGNVDEAAIEDLKKKNDYIKLPMDGIGRANPFENL